nr:proton pump-interactor 1-like [Ipomoea batatas]
MNSLYSVDLDGVRKEQQVLSPKLKEIDYELDVMKKEIGTLEEELTALTQQRDKTFQSIQEFRKQREEGSRKLNLEARQLVDKKDVAALREPSKTEVDKFVAQWSSNKWFRDDYEKRILQSLDMRQLSKDGRMRNPYEKPLKASKEDSAPPPQPDASLVSKAQKDKNSKQQKGGKKKPSENSLEVSPFLLQQLGGQPLNIVSGAADEILAVLKNDNIKNPEKKKEIEKLLNPIPNNVFE